MVECKKERGIRELVKDGLRYVATIVSASVFSPIAEGAETVMTTIEKKIMQIEKRIVKNISSLVMIGFGSIFLILALLFFLIEQLRWSKTAAFLSIGIIIFVTGVLLKASKTDS